MRHFLIVFSRPEGELVEPVRAYDDAAAAFRDRFERERRYREMPAIEVVVLSAESEDAIRQTHARYFLSTSELIGSAGA